MFNFILDYILGPILSFFGVITIDEEGNWTGKEKDKYEKKERPEKKTLSKRFKEWWEGLNFVRRFREREFATSISDIREKIRNLNGKPVKQKPQELQSTISNAVKKIVSDNYRSQELTKKNLRKISKFEGKSLLSTGKYRIWYGDHFPYDWEAEEGVIYVIRGAGDEVFPRANIRYDAYYVWDKTNKTFENLDLFKKEDDEFGPEDELSPSELEPGFGVKLEPVKVKSWEEATKDAKDASAKIKENLRKLQDDLREIKESNDDLKKKVTDELSKSTLGYVPGGLPYRYENKIDPHTGEVTHTSHYYSLDDKPKNVKSYMWPPMFE